MKKILLVLAMAVASIMAFYVEGVDIPDGEGGAIRITEGPDWTGNPTVRIEKVSSGRRTAEAIARLFFSLFFRGSDSSADLSQEKLAQKLFADEDFAKRIDVSELQNAITVRNVEGMTSCAWELKGVELILGKKDKTTTSDMIFASAAKLAVEQGNAEALKQIVALSPECKKFEEQLVLKGKTRGMNKSVTAFPQLMLLPKKDWQKTLPGLQDWEQPVLDRYICSAFRGMDKQSADTASMLVNQGRITMNPQMIAMGALELSKYPYNSELGIKLEPSQIFAEAVELAIAKQDNEALKQIAALYETAGFKTAEFGKYLQDELTILGNTRGLEKERTKYVPGDFSPANFHWLLRTVYDETSENEVK